MRNRVSAEANGFPYDSIEVTPKGAPNDAGNRDLFHSGTVVAPHPEFALGVSQGARVTAARRLGFMTTRVPATAGEPSWPPA